MAVDAVSGRVAGARREARARLTQVAPLGDADPAALVAAAREGDRAAFDELVRSSYRDTYRLALRLTADEEDARDVVQEAYLRAYRGLGKFRGDARFTTWLYRITANCAASHRSRSSRHHHVVLEDDATYVDERSDLDLDGRAERLSLRAELEVALGELPPRLRTVVVLHDVYGLAHEAIATELGISETAAKVRLHRARVRLRERLFPPVAGGQRDVG